MKSELQNATVKRVKHIVSSKTGEPYKLVTLYIEETEEKPDHLGTVICEHEFAVKVGDKARAIVETDLAGTKTIDFIII